MNKQDVTAQEGIDSKLVLLEKPQLIWSVYLIRTASNTLYCGVTTDVQRRYAEHQGGKKGAKYLKGKGPLTLAWHEEVGDKRFAMQIEYRIKKLSKIKKEALIAQQLNLEILVL